VNIDFVEGEKAYIPYVVIVAIEAAHHHAMSFSVSLRGRLLLGSLPNMRVFFCGWEAQSRIVDRKN
jgi:hypothetical protein